MAAATSLSPALARRIALAAQGFGRPRPAAVGTRQLGALIQRLGVLQLDSVNVFERSHYLPVFTRLGGYDKSLLDRITLTTKAGHLEYWAHQAAVLPREDWPLMRWRMERMREKYSAETRPWIAANGPLLSWLRAEVARTGPITASDIEHEANVRKGDWWGWSDVKEGLEYLFLWGELVSAGRRGFERRYAVPEQVLPAEILQREVPATDAHRELIRRAAAALGVATTADLADYYRMAIAQAKQAVLSLVDAGELLPVTVPGWSAPGYLWHGARQPRRMEAAALLSPFDPVVWFRPRTERLFDFHYRIEIYTPAPKRVYGYYSLPILLDDRVVGRIDLKSDRQAGVLRVQSAWQEPGAPAETAERVAALVREAAAWQGLAGAETTGVGNLGPALASELAR